MTSPDRRRFLRQTAAVFALEGGSGLRSSTAQASGRGRPGFAASQRTRRRELWRLLGDLPWRHKPARPVLIRSEKHDGYTLERLVLDLNGIEPVPAMLLLPEKRAPRAPGLLYIHWHAGMYDLGKEQLVDGARENRAWAPILAEQGIVALAIDSWCFGERRHAADGRTGEEDAFKLMLWRGQVLFGMMMFDEVRALDYLAGRPEVDAGRLGVMGMSMGATKAWWLAALDPRVRLCLDVCCLTDFDELIRAGNLKGHGIFYFVPSLLRHFDTAAINGLIVPRARLSLNGRQDDLTPPAGVDKVRDRLLPLYRKHGREEDCRIELFECGHVELPEMRGLMVEWLERHLVRGGKPS